MDLTIGSPLRGQAYPWLTLSLNLGYTEWDPRPSWRQLFEPGTYTPVIHPPLLLLLLLIHFLFSFLFLAAAAAMLPSLRLLLFLLLWPFQSVTVSAASSGQVHGFVVQ
ncbi:hypothetical protein BO99DRAFT_249293 [Aspergillus violaceofuscus CBS 115571]|uniref:Uncharacterized protein n=1 Tax=Aspergillus violaceofuscus (strain CBS 115571) TaxID=1450538 RepID=A0A2V5HUG6_ASPV1|nr:hypothetical protein BO99DRAFT_249293 [Aspergillus violaceofuscus CBS 115571]